MTCPRCDGKGKIGMKDGPAGGQRVGDVCQRCGGTGVDQWA